MRTITGTKYSECSVDGCTRDATRVSWNLCEMHHARVRRHGSTDKKNNVKEGKLVHCGGGYLMVYAPDHPMRRGSSPRVYEHRMVYYDAHGEGPFKCYHCDAPQSWDTMHVDHLDGDTANNCTDNLVASCPECNQKRGRWKIKTTMQERGAWMIEFNGERLHVSEWADRIGISSAAMKERVKQWPLAKAITKPKGPTGPKAHRDDK